MGRIALPVFLMIFLILHFGIVVGIPTSLLPFCIGVHVRRVSAPLPVPITIHFCRIHAPLPVWTTVHVRRRIPAPLLPFWVTIQCIVLIVVRPIVQPHFSIILIGSISLPLFIPSVTNL